MVADFFASIEKGGGLKKFFILVGFIMGMFTSLYSGHKVRSERQFIKWIRALVKVGLLSSQYPNFA